LSLIRKAIWPSLTALTVLVLLAAMGQTSTPSVQAAVKAGEICQILDNNGDPFDSTDEAFDTIGVGETKDYVFVVAEDVEEGTGDADDDGYELLEDDANVDVDDSNGGDAAITSLFGDDLNNPTDILNEIVLEDLDDNVCGETDDDLIAGISSELQDIFADAIEDGEPCTVLNSTACADPTPDDTNHQGGGLNGDGLPGGAPDLKPGVNDGDIDCGYIQPLGQGSCNISNALIVAAADAVAAEIFDGNDDCDDLGQVAEHAIILAANGPDNVTNEFVAGQFHDYIQDTCHNQWIDEDQAGDWSDIDYSGLIGNDAFIEVDVTCYESGTFDLSVALFNSGDAAQIHIACGGNVDKNNSTITAIPTRVEIVPAAGSVSHSLVFVNLKDKDNNPAFFGGDVFFQTDKCSIESSYFDNSDPAVRETNFEATETLFRNYQVNFFPSSVAVEGSAAALKLPDTGAPQEDNTTSFQVTSGSGTVRTVAAAILFCGPDAAQNVTPGTANITAIVEVLDGSDVVLKTTVTVVGPPAGPILVAADQSNVKCGDRATITVTVKDAAGQNVSDHTRVEAITNAGGVLGGTGSTLGNFDNVNPVSSTVAETFNGVATFYLITSEAQPGLYDVTVSTGGGGAVSGQQLGGLFSTPVVTGHVQVTCASQVPTLVAVQQPAAPAPSATITAPRTGQGITAPNTGDAGLVATDNGSNWALFVVIGGVAFALAGVASVKFARR
jgi:hypothetical protein